MKQNQKQTPLALGITVLALLLNAMIVKAAFTTNQELFWALIISLPVLGFSVYHGWPGRHAFRKHFNNDPQAPVQEIHFLRLSHSTYPNRIEPSDLRVLIGNDQCSKPYEACLLNIGAMGNTYLKWPSSPDLSGEDTGCSGNEGLTIYDLAAGGLVWQIGPDYLGCRTANGHFDGKAFKRIKDMADVKMIEIRLTSGKNSGYPVEAILDIAGTTGAKMDSSIFPGSGYTTFREAEGLIHFMDGLRELSGGKPVGLRLSIYDKKEFRQICHAIRKTQIIPDFIVVEDSFEKARILHSEHSFYSGLPLYEALLFVSQMLQAYALHKDIKVIAAGKIISSFDMLKLLALGANAVCAEISDFNVEGYGSMQDALAPHWKDDVHDFHHRIMKETAQAMNACGFRSLADITLSRFIRRLDVLQSKRSGQQDDQILYPGTVSKMNLRKTKIIQTGSRRAKDKITLQ